ncbi:hypothetical protein BDR22DRAFT_978147 [Usnea florida]
MSECARASVIIPVLLRKWPLRVSYMRIEYKAALMAQPHFNDQKSANEWVIYFLAKIAKSNSLVASTALSVQERATLPSLIVEARRGFQAMNGFLLSQVGNQDGFSMSTDYHIETVHEVPLQDLMRQNYLSIKCNTDRNFTEKKYNNNLVLDDQKSLDNKVLNQKVLLLYLGILRKDGQMNSEALVREHLDYLDEDSRYNSTKPMAKRFASGGPALENDNHAATTTHEAAPKSTAITDHHVADTTNHISPADTNQTSVQEANMDESDETAISAMKVRDMKLLWSSKRESKGHPEQIWPVFKQPTPRTLGRVLLILTLNLQLLPAWLPGSSGETWGQHLRALRHPSSGLYRQSPCSSTYLPLSPSLDTRLITSSPSPLKRRIKPEYTRFYRSPMKGIEDEHSNIIDEESDGGCGEECRVDADESHSDEDGDDDHVDGRA